MANVGEGNQQPPVANPEDVLRRDNVREGIEDVRRAVSLTDTVVTAAQEHDDDEPSYESLISIISTALNGTKDVKEQKVTVSYLTQDQQLLIPAALAMHPFNPELSESLHDALVVSRYKKVGTLSFVAILDLFATRRTAAERRGHIDGLPIDETRTGVQMMSWNSRDFATDRDGNPAPPEHVAYFFGLLSRSLQINCDIRDVGKLVMPEFRMRVRDGDWYEPIPDTANLLASKLEAYSLDCLAGLNLGACRNWKIGAWTRAFGVACGVLPHSSTSLRKEWKFVKNAPTQATLAEIATTHAKIGDQLMTLCLNVLAMFGLFHLNKNHTYKTGDDNMERVCNSYIMTLRTMVDNSVIDEMKANKEVACRTAAHPFGLGQTYWLAKALHHLDAMPSPLRLRLDVCPPLVQRLLVTEAACKEWTTVPAGALFNQLFQVHLSVIRAEIENIRTVPPAYSELFKLYGIEQMRTVLPAALASANSLMPLISGYAMAMHVDENNNKDGLALALSFQNVERDFKVATKSYTQLWTNYIDGIDQGGLEEFVRKSYGITEGVDVQGNIIH